MRGKTVSILLIAVFFASLIANIGFVQPAVGDTTIAVEPSNVKAYPGEYFTTDITIEHAENVYAWEVRLTYPPYRSVLAPTAIQEGPWLAQGGMTYFAENDKPFDGVYLFGSTLLGPMAGVSGSGVLATITWNVLDAGEGPLTIETSLVEYVMDIPEPELRPLPHQNRDGYFDGVNAELVMINIGARSQCVGETKEFLVKVNHEDQKFSGPLQVMARIDSVRKEDGMTTTFWAGQSYQYPPLREPETLYVDGFDYTKDNWTETGASPYLDAPDDGNYIEGTFDAAQQRWFSFEDLSTIDASLVDYVQLEGYTDGPYDEGVDYDIYSQDFNWLGSLYGNGAPEWQVPRWTSDPSHVNEPGLLDPTFLNDFAVMVYYYDPDGLSMGDDHLDALYIEVGYKVGRVAIPVDPPVYMVEPGEVTWIGEGAVWPLQEEDVGTYTTTVTVFYSYNGLFFVEATKQVISEDWQCRPAK